MKFIISLILYSFIAINSSAQKKLNINVNKNTGDTTYSTSEIKIYTGTASKNAVGEYLKSAVYRTGDAYMICFSIQTGRTSVFSIDAGATASIELKDGNVISLSSTGDHTSRPSRLAYGSYIFAFYRLGISVTRQLMNSPVSSITIQSSTGRMDYPIKEKFANTIADQLAKLQ